MRTLVLVLVLTVGCAKHVIRDAKTYDAELSWNEQAMRQAGDRLLEEARQHLEAGELEDCRKSAALGLVLATRGPYHAQMARFLGGLTDQDPGDPPPIPGVTALCGGDP